MLMLSLLIGTLPGLALVFTPQAVKAIQTQTQPTPVIRTIKFSGYDWNVKSSDLMGPGPNRWNPANVWVDGKGWLHLKITQKDGKWECAEVASLQRFGFGTYEFEIAGPSRIDQFDINTVLGLFNYPTPDVGGDGTNEIDVEFAHWGMEKAPPGNFTVWPPVKEAHNNTHPFSFALKSNSSTHSFTWTTNGVVFASTNGSGRNAAKGAPLQEWSYTPENSAERIPQHPMPVLMNLWLFRGHAPTDGKDVEIVVQRFRFTALK